MPTSCRPCSRPISNEAAQLWNQGLTAHPAATDKRFASDAWSTNPVAGYSAALYLLNARALLGLVEAVKADDKTRARLRFAVDQWMAATAPSNFMALNAEAQRKALETGGESIAKGVQNLMKDIQQGHVSMTDESLFEVGRNVATTEGAVVFENELFQLIEYKPLTATVYERPFLLVPPCINKFYILDLQPDNSLVRYLVSQGHRTFLVSWRNADDSMADKTWDDYVGDGALKAIDVVRDITACAADQRAGLLRRRNDPRRRARGAGRAAREAGGIGHAAHGVPRLFRDRRARRVHRRGLRQVPRNAVRRKAAS